MKNLSPLQNCMARLPLPLLRGLLLQSITTSHNISVGLRVRLKPRRPSERLTPAQIEQRKHTEALDNDHTVGWRAEWADRVLQRIPYIPHWRRRKPEWGIIRSENRGSHAPMIYVFNKEHAVHFSTFRRFNLDTKSMYLDAIQACLLLPYILDFRLQTWQTWHIDFWKRQAIKQIFNGFILRLRFSYQNPAPRIPPSFTSRTLPPELNRKMK